MKAIGIECWVPTQEEETSNSRILEELPPVQEKKLSQKQRQSYLLKLASKLEKEGLQFVLADENRIRVLAPDDQVDALLEHIDTMVGELCPSRDMLAVIKTLAVPDGTPLEERATWDENRASGIEDFSEFHPCEEELLVLAKYWREQILGECWLIDMCRGRFNNRNWDLDRPEARIARIKRLLGEEAVAKAVAQAEENFRQRQDPVEWKAFMDGQQNSEYEVTVMAIKSFAETMSLDEARKKLLEDIAWQGDPEFMKKLRAALQALINRDLSKIDRILHDTTMA